MRAELWAQGWAGVLGPVSGAAKRTPARRPGDLGDQRCTPSLLLGGVAQEYPRRPRLLVPWLSYGTLFSLSTTEKSKSAERKGSLRTAFSKKKQ